MLRQTSACCFLYVSLLFIEANLVVHMSSIHEQAYVNVHTIDLDDDVHILHARYIHTSQSNKLFYRLPFTVIRFT